MDLIIPNLTDEQIESLRGQVNGDTAPPAPPTTHITKTVEELTGHPLGEQPQSVPFPLEGINPNGLKDFVSRSGFTQQVGDNTDVTYPAEWQEDEEYWMVTDSEGNTFTLDWPGNQFDPVMFRFIVYQGAYCVEIKDGAPRD